jgi:hypothetical protein
MPQSKPLCQRCGDKDGTVLFMDIWVLCPECWVAANGKDRARQTVGAGLTPGSTTSDTPPQDL